MHDLILKPSGWRCGVLAFLLGFHPRIVGEPWGSASAGVCGAAPRWFLDGEDKLLCSTASCGRGLGVMLVGGAQ